MFNNVVNRYIHIHKENKHKYKTKPKEQATQSYHQRSNRYTHNYLTGYLTKGA